MKKRKTAETANGSSVYTGLYYKTRSSGQFVRFGYFECKRCSRIWRWSHGGTPTCNVVQLQAMEWDLQCEGTLLVWIYDATVDFVVYEPGTR